jgi:hypothetical protein
MTQSKKPMKENVENTAIGYAMGEKKRQVWKSEGAGTWERGNDERYKRVAVPCKLKMDTPL